MHPQNMSLTFLLNVLCITLRIHLQRQDFTISHYTMINKSRQNIILSFELKQRSKNISSILFTVYSTASSKH